MNPTGKSTIITGGGKGLGREIALALAAAGSRLFLCGREERELGKTCEEIQKHGGVCAYRTVDLAKKSAPDAMIRFALRAFGRIEILVNNAGWCGKPKALERVGVAEYERYFAVNVRQQFLFMRRVIPMMRKQKSGIIVNVCSTAGHRVNSILPIYSATKFALRAFTQAVGKDSGARVPRCVSVSPAGMNTAMRRLLFGKKDAEAQQSPRAIAEVVKKIITGEIEVPNGGDAVVRDGRVIAPTAPQ